MFPKLTPAKTTMIIGLGMLLLEINVTHSISTRYTNIGLNQDGYNWENFKNKEGNTVDRHRLLQLYALMCPVPEPCGSTNYYGLELNITGDDKYDIYYKSCKNCLCHDSCLTFKNCCPDLTASFIKHECVDTALYRSPSLSTETPIPGIDDVHSVKTGHRRDEDDLFGVAEEIFYASNSWNLMVTSCPPEATKEQILYCNAGKTEPVSGNRSQISYRNEYCAACNHDDADLVSWNVTFVCNEEMEFVNYGSGRFMSAMEEFGCVVKYDPQQTYDAHKYNPPSYPCDYFATYEYKLERCNVTGLWREYDPDIEWACEHLNLVYKWRYKNVFCYICNPSLVSTSSEIIYDRCNMTGLWKMYDTHIERRCLNASSVERLAPFKNVYCMKCNGYNRTNKIDLNKMEMDKEYGLSRIEEAYVTENHTVPNVTIFFQIKGIDVVEQTRKTAQLLYPDFENFSYDVRREELTQPFAENRTFLYDAVHRVCGYVRHCSGNSTSHEADDIGASDIDSYGPCNCSCKSTCAANDNCCIDILLQKMPYTCIEEPRIFTIEHSVTHLKSDEGASMTVVGKCLNRDNTDLVDKCEIDNFNRTDILQNIPVFQGGIYKNVYCLVCNEQNPEPVFKIEAICNHYLETALTKTVSQLSEMLQRHCKAQLFPPGYDRYCSTRKELEENPGIISTCNQTGLWFNYDEQIVAGCEDEEHSTVSFMPIYALHLSNVTMLFKNYMCFLCNPRETYMKYANCIEGHKLDTLCRENEMIPAWLPYKNVYCYLCDRPYFPDVDRQTEYKQAPTPAHMSTVMDASLGTTYRMMFALSQEEWLNFYPESSNPNQVCSMGYTYDYAAKSCRVILCSTDRVLVNGECIAMAQLVPTGFLSISLDFEFENYFPRIDFGHVDFNENMVIDLIRYHELVSLEFLCQKIISYITKSLVAEGISVRINLCAIITRETCGVHSDDEINNQLKHPVIAVMIPVKFLMNLRIAIYNKANLQESQVVLGHIFKKPYEFTELRTGFRVTASYEVNLKDFTLFRSEGNPCETEMLYPLAHEQLSHIFTTGEPLGTSKIDTCVQIQLTPAEYFHNATANTISIHNGTQILREGEFKFIDSTDIRVCKSDYEISRAQPSTGLTPFHRAHNVFSYVVTIVSLLCLLLTLATYSMFPDLRTVPGKNVMSLCASLFVAQGSLQFSSFILTYEVICVPFAVLTHYSWLATFCAMNVCSFHMYLLFYNKMVSSPAAHKNLEHTKYYLMYTYLIPLFIVALTLAVHYGISKGEFSGYGKYACSLSDIYTITCSFIVPAAIIFIANFSFFAMAFYAIRTSPRVACTKRDKREFYIYLKLCALTGISWPLQIIDGMLPLTVFSFVAVFINALQGFYIFISYVCNARVYRLYDRLLTGKGVTYMEEDTPATASSAFSKSKNVPSLKHD